MSDDAAKAAKKAERAAKRQAHAWERSIRARPAGADVTKGTKGTSSSAKLAAVTFADRARLITRELASELGLGAEYIGTIAAWPSVASLAADMGQKSEGTTRGFIDALAGRDLIVHQRRHLRASSVYVLAVDGRPIKVARPLGSEQSGDRSDPSSRANDGDRLDPSGREAQGDRLDPAERPLGSEQFDRSDPIGPLKEEPISEPISEPKSVTVEALELVAPTAHAVAARRSVKRADGDRELMNAARKATEAAYRRAHEPFPGGALAWNSSEWRQLAQWARSAVEVGLDIGRRYDVEAVLVAAIDASVAADPQKPIGFWRHRLNETWKQIRNRVPFERVEARADDSRRAAP